MVVTCFTHGWCTLHDGVCARAEALATEAGARFEEIDTSEPASAWRHGHVDALFVGRRSLTKGPPVTDDAIRRALERERRRIEPRRRWSMPG